MSYETGYYGTLGQLSEVDKRLYAKKHNYTLIVNNKILDSSRKPSWFKVLMAQEHLAFYDWLVYIDTDTLIMEHQIPFEKFIDDRYDMVITKDHKGINAGVWMIKNSKWSHNFLANWYETGTLFVTDPTITFGRSGDQDTLKHLLKSEENAQQVKILPQCSFNSYPYWRESWTGVYMKGDFLLHLAGKGTPDLRAEIFEAFRKGDYYIMKDN